MLEGVLAPGRHRQRGLDPRLPARGQDRHRQQGRPGHRRILATAPTSPRSSASRPPRDPKLLCAVVVDEPQAGLDLRRHGRGAGVRADHELRAALPGHRAARLSAALRRGRKLDSAPCLPGGSPMRLDELHRASPRRAGRRRPRPEPSRSPRSPTTAARSRPATLFFCVSGFRSDGHDFAAAGGRSAGAVALVVERPLGLGVPEVLVASARAAMAPLAARFYGDPSAELRVRRRHRHERQDDHRLPGARAARRRRGAAVRAARHGQVGDRRARARGDAHDPGGDRPAGRPSRDARRRRPRLRDGGLLARARARTRRRRSRFAAAIFTNLTQDHLDFHPTMEDYFLAKRRLFMPAARRAAGRQRRSTSTTPTAGGSAAELAGARHLRASTPPADYRARRAALRPRRLPLHAAHARRASARSRCRCRGASTSPTRSARSPPRTRLGGDARRARRRARAAACACPAASSRSTRARTSPCSSTTPTRPTRSRTCSRAARELTAARRAAGA